MGIFHVFLSYTNGTLSRKVSHRFSDNLWGVKAINLTSISREIRKQFLLLQSWKTNLKMWFFDIY